MNIDIERNSFECLWYNIVLHDKRKSGEILYRVYIPPFPYRKRFPFPPHFPTALADIFLQTFFCRHFFPDARASAQRITAVLVAPITIFSCGK